MTLEALAQKLAEEYFCKLTNEGVLVYGQAEQAFLAGATNLRMHAIVRAQVLEELGDRLNVAHTAEMDIFPEFHSEQWDGANYLKVRLANKLWKEAEESKMKAEEV